MDDILLPVTVGGITFKNPFYAASGPETKTVKQLVRIEETGWAAASIKLSMDPAPYINGKPRYALFKEYNALAFTADRRLSLDEGLRLVKEAKKVLSGLILMANIAYVGGDGPAGWVRMAKKFEDAGADILELNMCCPNMSYNLELTAGEAGCGQQRSGASLGRNGGEIAEIVSAIKTAVKIPLFVKLTPEGGDIAHTAALLYAAGADAVGGTSNRMGMPRINLDDPGRSPYHLQDEISMSCFCGHWLKPLTLRDTFEIRKLNGMKPAVMMAGGVSGWKDAAELILCGADLVGVCTEILINGYDIARPMIRGVADYMEKHGYASISDMKGALAPLVRTANEITLRDGYARIKNPGLSAPCKAACPENVPVQAIALMILNKNYRRAYELLVSANLPRGICPDTCDGICEKACVRSRTGRPLAIKKLIRFIYDYAARQGWGSPACVGQNDSIKSTVIPSAGLDGSNTATTTDEHSAVTTADEKNAAAEADEHSAVTTAVDEHSAVIAADEKNAAAEAERCLKCGCGEGCQLCKTICCYFAPDVIADDTLGIDRDECVACGICLYRCPSGNIEMVRA